MKRIIAIVIVWGLLPWVARAKGVTKEEAIRVAVERCQSVAGGYFPAEARRIRLVEKEGKPCYYIIQFQPEGWALVSADDRATPVLGYSPTGCFYEDDQPSAMQWWLNEYAEGVKSLSGSLRKQRHALWDRKEIHTRASARIEPFIQVKWDQSAPYNKYCPENTKGEKAIVGCVAVAFAQAMSVFQKPDRPVGRNGYTDDDFGLVSVNFDREPPYNWEAIMSGSDGNSETARLLYHCGVAVNMDYGKNGSGAYSNRILKALSDYFSYPPSSAKYYKRNSYTGDWIALITNELAAGRPVVYDGENDKGTSAHAFNLDGFDGSNSFHVNWGWRGKNNGYFTLENLNDGNFNYLNNHGALVGIYFDGSSSTEEIRESAAVRLYVGANGEWILESAEAGRYQIYNMAGNQLASGTFQAGTELFSAVRALSPAVYIASFSYGGKRTVQKIIVNLQ